VMRENS